MSPPDTRHAARQFDPTVMRHVRLLRGLSRRQLADLAGISENAVGQIERGEIRPSLRRLPSIADALGIPVDFLLREQTGTTLSSDEVRELLRHSYPAAARDNTIVAAIHAMLGGAA